MEINRRIFLGGALGVAALGVPQPACASDRQTLYAATRRGPDSRYSAAIFDAHGQDRNAISLPARGHDVTVCLHTKRCVAFARRPGNFAAVFSADRSSSPFHFTTPEDRHFYGHGVFSTDGKQLFTTENDFQAGKGRIGIYDATDRFKRIGEFSAYGVGPHDLALAPDGRTLIIANGGIATHPDVGEGRMALNLTTMHPNLAYIDLRDGRLIERVSLAQTLRQSSLRHLDISADGQVIIGCQSKAEDGSEMPLILRHRLGRELDIVSLPDNLSAAMRGYVSSVALDRTGEFAALTSARGGIALFLDVARARIIGTCRLNDVSGVASDREPGHFLLTTGEGHINSAAAPDHPGQTTQTNWQWDNHAIRL